MPNYVFRYGDFMVRESGSVDGYIALSVRADDKVCRRTPYPVPCISSIVAIL